MPFGIDPIVPFSDSVWVGAALASGHLSSLQSLKRNSDNLRCHLKWNQSKHSTISIVEFTDVVQSNLHRPFYCELYTNVGDELRNPSFD